jgi:hypothetical protein
MRQVQCTGWFRSGSGIPKSREVVFSECGFLPIAGDPSHIQVSFLITRWSFHSLTLPSGPSVGQDWTLYYQTLDGARQRTIARAEMILSPFVLPQGRNLVQAAHKAALLLAPVHSSKLFLRPEDYEQL